MGRRCGIICRDIAGEGGIVENYRKCGGFFFLRDVHYVADDVQ